MAPKKTVTDMLAESGKVIQKEGTPYIELHEYLDLIEENLKLQAMLKQTAEKGISREVLIQLGFSVAPEREQQHV